MKLKKQLKVMSSELIDFYDDFADFHERSAFICDALGHLVIGECDTLDTDTANGVRRQAEQMKRQLGKFRQELRRICDLSHRPMTKPPN